MAYDKDSDGPDSELEQAKKDYKYAVDYWAPQHQRADEDVAFQVGENQWSDTAKKERAGRPTISISLLQQPRQLVYNQAASARMGVNLHPASETADKELAEIMQGLYQNIQRTGGADHARLWGLDYATQTGLAWYEIDYEYDDDGDDPFDLKIVYRRLVNQKDVLPDPSAQEADFSDARWILKRTYVPYDDYCRQYPESQIADGTLDFDDLAETEPDWVSVKGDKKAVLVLVRFYKKHEYKELKDRGRTRRIDRVSVCRQILNAVEILEDEPFGGEEGYGIPYIPLVPILGRELQPINGQRRWEGMVRPARGAQEVFNWSTSSMVEDVGRASKVPYVGAAGQFEGYTEKWDSLNTKNWSYVEFNAFDLDGRPYPNPPTPMQIDGTKMQMSMQLAQEARALVQAATAVHEPSLGDIPKRKDAQSGRAILALQQQSDAGTSNYLENMRLFTLPYEAKVVLALMPTCYSRPGRITQVLGGEDESKPVMLNAPFVMDGSGRPQPADMTTTGAKLYDLRKAGKYSVVPSVGKSHQTRLESGQAFVTEVVGAFPELMPMAGDLVFKFRDEPGAKEIAERLKRQIAHVSPWLLEDGEQDSPESLKAKAAAAQAQAQEAQQQLMMAIQELKTDQAKQMAMLQKAEMDNQTKLELERMESEAQAREDALELKIEEMRLEFEREKLQFEAAHDVAMAAAGGSTVTTSREGGQETGQEREDETSQGGSTERSNQAENRPEASE